MKHDQTAFAAQSAYADPQAVERRVRDFLPLVHKAAWHVYGAGRDGLEVEDLVQVGLLALTQCARRHDRPTEDGFAAYAKMRVRGAMVDHLRKLAIDTRSAIRRQRAADEAAETFRGAHGREPDPGELAHALGIDVGHLPSYRAERLREVTLDEHYDEHHIAFADQEQDALSQLVEAEERERLTALIAGLPDRLQLVLQLYFVEELNLAEIAEALGVSVPRVHQLKAQALGKLREALED